MMALPTRLFHTWGSSSTLPVNSTGAMSAVRVCAFSLALPSSSRRQWLTCSSSQKVVRDTGRFPVSSLVSSRASLASSASWVDSLAMIWRYFFCSASVKPGSWSSSAKPRMAVRGVLNSWVKVLTYSSRRARTF